MAMSRCKANLTNAGLALIMFSTPTVAQTRVQQWLQQNQQQQQQWEQRVQQQQQQQQQCQPSEAEKQLLHPKISKQEAQTSLKKAREACQYAMIDLKAAGFAMKQYAIVVQFDQSMMSDDDWQCYNFAMQRAL